MLLTVRLADPGETQSPLREVSVGEDVGQTEIVVVLHRVEVEEVADVDVAVAVRRRVVGVAFLRFVRHDLTKDDKINK